MNGDGKAHRKLTSNVGGPSLYRWLREHNYPDGFQLLCKQCNFAKQTMTHAEFVNWIAMLHKNFTSRITL